MFLCLVPGHRKKRGGVSSIRAEAVYMDLEKMILFIPPLGVNIGKCINTNILQRIRTVLILAIAIKIWADFF